MPLANFSNLDFDQVKITLQDYLKSNSNFTDYDFEGSNLSTILDVLAYNTYNSTISMRCILLISIPISTPPSYCFNTSSNSPFLRSPLLTNTQ